LGLEGDKQIKAFNESQLGKPRPATYDEMNLLIGIMVDEANKIAARGNE
jgi:hypothetical protein